MNTTAQEGKKKEHVTHILGSSSALLELSIVGRDKYYWIWWNKVDGDHTEQKRINQVESQHRVQK